MRSLHLLSRQHSGLLVIDLQERFIPIIPQFDRVVWNATRLLRGAAIMQVPATATVQYPQGLGPLVPALTSHLTQPFEKMRFSAVIEPIELWLEQNSFAQLVLCGIETHVCILQTALDLLAKGLDVYVPVDAVAATSELNHRIALDRLLSCGATLTSVESVLFEWCETAADPQFKALSALVREKFSDSNQ